MFNGEIIERQVFSKKQTPLKTRCVVCIQDFTEIGCVLQFSSRNTDQTSKQRQGKKRQDITCQPIGKCVAVKRSCVVWEQDPFQGICCKKTNRKLGEGDWYIYSSGDPGAGGCRSRVDLTGVESLRISGRWRMAGWKVPTKCMNLGEMRNGFGLRQSA